MLKQLVIRNIVLIDQLDIQFESGLCVLTGETGAGKSILLDALGFVLGGRSSSHLLRHGAEKGVVTASFEADQLVGIKKLLDDHEIDSDEELLLRRTINAQGKSKAFINDTAVSVSLLKSIGDQLLEIHGQHDQSQLLSSASHRDILDAYGQLDKDVEMVGQAFVKLDVCKKQIATLQADTQKALAEQDYLSFVVKELEQLAPATGEEEELAEKRTRLMNREKHEKSISQASDIIHGQQLEKHVHQLQQIFNTIADESTEHQAIINCLEQVSIELNEVSNNISALQQSTSGEGESLEMIEERLFALRAAARKYRVSVEELPDFKVKMEHQLLLIEHSTEKLQQLEAELDVLKQGYTKLALHLTKHRQEVADALTKRIEQELAPLKMDKAQFKVNITSLDETSYRAHGMDHITFFASMNPGTPVAPLAKIASGGELSRFMLAMKVVLANVKSVPTLIFDEIDTGVGGAVANAIGKRLALLGQHVQVVVITHQPQVACMGSMHLRVHKEQQAEQTLTKVTSLNHEQRREELARMLAGEHITDEARAAADQLMVVKVA